MVYKKVRLVEKDKILSLQDKTELLLVYANQKPTTILFFNPSSSPEPCTSFYNEKDISKISKLLNRMNILYKVGKKQVYKFETILMSNGLYFPAFTISRIPLYVASNLDNLINTEKADKTEDHRLLRELCGFPDTAIQAFLGERERYAGNWINKSPLSFFTGFIFSADYHQEELINTSLRWHNIIKRLSPKLYSKIAEKTKTSEVTKSYPIEIN